MSSLNRENWVSQKSDSFFPINETIGRFEVAAVTSHCYLLTGADTKQVVTATRAVSCLLEPLTGDHVLAFPDTATNEVFILAVLTRSKNKPQRSYAFSETVQLQANAGDLNLHANSIRFEAEQGEYKFKRFHGVYGQLSETADTVSLVASELTQTIGRFWGHFRDFFKRVDGLDRTQAGSIQQTAEHKFLLRSDFTKIRAKHVVKVDANKIDLG